MAAKQAIARALAKLAITAESRLRPTAVAANPSEVRSVLILEYMLPLGACVHMTPVFEALKRRPAAPTITVATRGLGLDVLRHSPYIDHLLETPDPLRDLPAATRSLKRQLRERGLRPDCCLTGASDQRTRIALFGALACAGWRGGFTVIDQLYQRPLRYDPTKSLIGNNLRVAGLAGSSEELLEPRVFFSEAHAAKARQLLAPLRAVNKPILIVVSQNSGGQRTGWHNERWAQTLRHAQDVLGYAAAYVGTAADAPAIEALQPRAGGVSLAGQTTVAELTALLAESDMVISLDTGTMHVGRTVGVPMVVLGPSWQKPLEWLPQGKPHVRILRGKDRPDVPQGYRLDEITAAQAIAALDDLTSHYPPDETARETRLQSALSAIDLLPR